jgi:hypothetical protein
MASQTPFAAAKLLGGLDLPEVLDGHGIDPVHSAVPTSN